MYQFLALKEHSLENNKFKSAYHGLVHKASTGHDQNVHPRGNGCCGTMIPQNTRQQLK